MGDIDEAMLFDAAIPADQVEYIYSLQYRNSHAGPPVPRVPGSTATVDMSRLPGTLVGYWPLDGDGGDMGPNHMMGSDHDNDADPNWTGTVLAHSCNLTFCVALRVLCCLPACSWEVRACDQFR
jgi:hypothetical protein